MTRDEFWQAVYEHAIGCARCHNGEMIVYKDGLVENQGWPVPLDEYGKVGHVAFCYHWFNPATCYWENPFILSLCSAAFDYLAPEQKVYLVER